MMRPSGLPADAYSIATPGGEPKRPACSCLKRLGGMMRPFNGAPGVHRDTGGAVIFLRRLDRSKPPPPVVVADFCPMCGVAYR